MAPARWSLIAGLGLLALGPEASARTDATSGGPVLKRTLISAGDATAYEGSQFRTVVNEALASQEDTATRMRRLAPVLAFCEPLLDAPGGTRRIGVSNAGEQHDYLASQPAGAKVSFVDVACPEAFATAAFIAVDAGDTATATRRLEQAQAMGPFLAAPHSEMGFLLNARGMRKEALAEYEQALALAQRYPRNASIAPVALRGIGWTQVELGRLDEAEAAYRRALELDKEPKRTQSMQAELGYIADVRQKKRPAPNTGTFDTKLAEPTDREKVVAYTRALESDPLDADAQAKRKWIVSWIEASPDVTVNVCDVLGTVGPKKKDEVRSDVASIALLQYMVGSAAYAIEHPGADPAGEDQQLAGARSAIRAYRALRQVTENTDVAALELLAAKDADGSLAAALAPAISKCRDSMKR